MMGNDEYKKKTLIISWNPFRELGKIISRFIGKEKKKEKKSNNNVMDQISHGIRSCIVSKFVPSKKKKKLASNSIYHV